MRKTINWLNDSISAAGRNIDQNPDNARFVTIRDDLDRLRDKGKGVIFNINIIKTILIRVYIKLHLATVQDELLECEHAYRQRHSVNANNFDEGFFER